MLAVVETKPNPGVIKTSPIMTAKTQGLVDYKAPHLRFEHWPKELLTRCESTLPKLKINAETTTKCTAVQVEGKFFKPFMSIVNALYEKGRGGLFREI